MEKNRKNVNMWKFYTSKYLVFFRHRYKSQNAHLWICLNDTCQLGIISLPFYKNCNYRHKIMQEVHYPQSQARGFHVSCHKMEHFETCTWVRFFFFFFFFFQNLIFVKQSSNICEIVRSGLLLCGVPHW